MSYLDNFRNHRHTYPFADVLGKQRPRGLSYDVLATVFECRDGAYTKIPFPKFEDLDNYWTSITLTPDTCKGRLYVVEDPTAEYIEALGSKFAIDPDFFVQHLYSGSMRNDERDRVSNRIVPRSISAQRRSPDKFFSLRYYEIRKFDTTLTFPWHLPKYSCANIPRKVLFEGWSASETPSGWGFIRRNISVWIRNANADSWNAIVLLEPKLSNALAFQQDRRLLPVAFKCPSKLYPYVDVAQPSFPSSESALGDLKGTAFDWIMQFCKSLEIGSDDSDAVLTPFNAMHAAERLVTQHWLAHIEYLTGYISELEVGLWTFECMSLNASAKRIRKEISALRTILRKVNSHRRYVWAYMDHMRYNLESLKHFQVEKQIQNLSTSSLESDPRVNLSLEILDDFEAIQKRLDYCKDRLESNVSVVVAAINLLDARKSSLDAERVQILTKAALIFVPLSLTAGIFSMSDKFLPGNSQFWMYWAVALPLALFVFCLFTLSTLEPSVGRTKRRTTVSKPTRTNGGV